MNGPDPVIVAVAAVMVAVFLLFLLLLFVNLRLWLQALLTDTPVGLFDIIGMRLRRCPPRLLVHAAITLSQRGVKVPARELEGYYLAAAVRGERPETAAELAALVEAVKRNEAPQT
jgi:uncharacterized protein YqfA (UPF0365 family)